MPVKAEELTEGKRYELLRGLYKLSLKEEYPWEAGGYAFVSHFQEVKKGWKLTKLLAHSGIPSSYKGKEEFIRVYQGCLSRYGGRILISYRIDPPPEGGFYAQCDVEIDKGEVTKTNIDRGHISFLPGFEPGRDFKETKGK
jgi:hypothetical protein